MIDHVKSNWENTDRATSVPLGTTTSEASRILPVRDSQLQPDLPPRQHRHDHPVEAAVDLREENRKNKSTID